MCMSASPEKTSIRMKSNNSFRPRLRTTAATASKLAFSLLLPAFCLAQQNKLVVSKPDPVIAKRGATVEAKLRVATIPGFHVNSDKPAFDYLIPLKLTWADGPLQTKAIRYPNPETIQLGPDKLKVFTGTFFITTAFTVPANAKPGDTEMTGKLHYQACNNSECFRPMTIDVKLPVNID